MRKIVAVFVAVGLALMASGLAYAQSIPEARYRIIGTAAGPNSLLLPIYTSPATGVVGDVNLAEVDGAAYDLGTDVMLGSLPVTLATDDTVMAAIDALLTTIAGDTTAITGQLPPTLGSQAIADSFSVVQAALEVFDVAIPGSVDVQGVDADAAAITGDPVLIGGDEGGTMRAIAVDSAGRPLVVGAAADGDAVDGNPVLMGGEDGGSTRTLHLDGTGDAQVDIASALPAGTNSIGTVDTELAIPVTMDDAMLNPGDDGLGAPAYGPEVPGVGSYTLGWENAGAVWERVRSYAGRLEVDLELIGGAQLTLGQQAAGSSIPVVSPSENAEDTLWATGDYGLGLLGVRTDQLGGATGIVPSVTVDNNYSALRTSDIGALYVGTPFVHGFGGNGAENIPGNPFLGGWEAKDFDGAALPNAVADEGDVVRGAATMSGVQYVMVVNEDGSDEGTITVQDGGGSLTVDGTVALSADPNALAVDVEGESDTQGGTDVSASQTDDAAGQYVVPSDAIRTTCQNQSDEVVAFKVGAIASGTGAGRLCAETAAGDGRGCSYTWHGLGGATIHFWDEPSAGPAVVACWSEVAN